MRISSIWPQLNYHDKQYRMWTTPERFVYCPAGRQSGKTELALRRLARFLAVRKDWPDPRYVFAAPTYMQAKRVAWHRLLSLIPENWIVDISRSELSIKTIFGSEVFLAGLDRPERIEGIMLDGIVIDESSDIKPGTFDLSVLPTLIIRSGWAWQIGVPKRFGIGAVEFRTRSEEAIAGKLLDSAGFIWPSSDIIPEKQLAYAKATMAERDYNEQFNASWLSASGGVFYAFDKEYNCRPCAYDENKTILVGQDFNVNPMCWIMCHIKGDVLEVFDELFLSNTNTPAALKVLLGRYPRHKGGFQMYGDSSARGRHTSAYSSDYNHIAGNSELKALGRTMHYTHSNPPRTDRFAVTNARINSGDNQRRVFIDPRCGHLITDLTIRSFKPGTRDTADAGDVGHSTDALGYLLYKLYPLGLVIPQSNKIIITTGAMA